MRQADADVYLRDFTDKYGEILRDTGAGKFFPDQLYVCILSTSLQSLQKQYLLQREFLFTEQLLDACKYWHEKAEEATRV